MVNQFQSNKGVKHIKPNLNNTYNQILLLIKYQPLSPKEIKFLLKQQEINISLPAIKKQIDNLVKNWETIALEKQVGYKNFLMRAYNKKWNSMIKRYYAYTPQSAKLYIKLKINTKDVTNTDLLIEDVLTSFQILESKSRLESYHFFNEKAIKKQFNGSIKLSQKNIQGIKENNRTYLDTFLNDRIKINSNLPIIKVKNKEYINLDEILIKKEVFINFLNVFYSEMGPIMRFTSYLPIMKEDFNRVMEKMCSLFLLIVRDYNYKVFNDFIK